MATNNLIDHYDRRALSDIAEELKPPTTFLVDTFWNGSEEFATDSVDVDIVDGARNTAPASERTEEGAQVNKRGFSTRTFIPKTYKPKITITPDDLMKRAPGGVIYDNSGSLTGPIQDFVAKQFTDLDDRITRSEEFQAKQALFSGSITYYDKDMEAVGAVVDLQRNAALTYTVGTLWSAATADPTADLRTARRLVQKHSGYTPTVALLGWEAADEFLSIAGVQKALSKDWSSRGQLAFDMRDNGAVWLGTIDGFDLWQYDAYIVNPSNDTEELIVPSKQVLVTAPNAPQTRLYGAVTVGDVEGNMFIEAASRYTDMYSAGRDPVGTVVQVHSAPLMARQHPNADAVLTVLT